MNRLLEALHSGRVLLMDGAMGTELQRLGMQDGECSALWNLTHPEEVCAVHAAYLEAGAEILLTNTFLAFPDVLAMHGCPDRLNEVWSVAHRNAAIFRDPLPIVLADIGPLSDPSTHHHEWREVVSLCRGADGLLVETWASSMARLCIYPASLNNGTGGPGLPFLTSFAYRRSEDSPLISAEVKNCVRWAELANVTAIGANCGREIDMDDLLEIVRVYRGETDLPIFIRPNAGSPVRTANGWEYPRSPEYMADKLWPLLEAGVTMVGGCCGTTPAHIAAFRQVVDEWNARQAKK
jgi:5-methyltetrahydrofolate--homocysteine methyltransferase